MDKNVEAKLRDFMGAFTQPVTFNPVTNFPLKVTLDTSSLVGQQCLDITC